MEVTSSYLYSSLLVFEVFHVPPDMEQSVSPSSIGDIVSDMNPKAAFSGVGVSLPPQPHFLHAQPCLQFFIYSKFTGRLSNTL